MTGAGPAPRPAADLLGQVRGADPPAFALLRRPESAGPGIVEVLVGTAAAVASLAEIPLPERSGPVGVARHDVLAVIPYRQVTERGFACRDDGAPLLALSVAEQATMTVSDLLRLVPDEPVRIVGGDFDLDDEAYAAVVRRVLTEEIGAGEGANFVIKRSYLAEIPDFTPRDALTVFRRLLERESGSYWTFVVHLGGRTLVGATPERHISLRDQTAVMTPISGTYRYPPSGPTLPEVLRFLDDRKETDELYMVLDEELKMMARICDNGGRVAGPYLREMARLAHTEYVIEGRSGRDPREILRETLLAPTVTGSPLESACRVIARQEPGGRGYYSGVLALFGRDERGAPLLDSAILIRTADIDHTGRLRIGVGATLVRHSDPAAEVAETRAKAAALLAALRVEAPARFDTHPRVRAALRRRNEALADFWLRDDARGQGSGLVTAGRRVLVVDAEDTFTSMLAVQLHSLGLAVTVRRFDEPYALDGADLVIMGPGPGDPGDRADPKIAHLRATLARLLEGRRPFLAICLSHQVLGTVLGFSLIRRKVPNQGTQRSIDLFGARERVGFYNTFALTCGEDKVDCGAAGVVEVSRDPDTGEVHALRGSHFATLQFHPESVLTRDGVRILGRLVSWVVNRR